MDLPGVKVQLLPLRKVEFIPLYVQIQQNLIDLVRSGNLVEGDLLPSEKELGRIFKVSRATARLALYGVKISGYAWSRRGLGTFVTTPEIEKAITQATHGIVLPV
jgi:GntR family transcriptional regulator